MPGLIGKKIGMTSIYNEDGKNIACTIIQVGPCVITQIKTKEKDGYDAVQLAFEDKKEKHSTKVVELRGSIEGAKVGDLLTADFFKDDRWIDVSGFSKGKGFQGVVGRYGFGGVGQSTHGQHNRLRAPGSIGASSYPSRVFKGMRMAGRTGNKKVKVINLRLIKVLPEDNLIVVKGAVPGYKGSYLIIEK